MSLVEQGKRLLARICPKEEQSCFYTFVQKLRKVTLSQTTKDGLLLVTFGFPTSIRRNAMPRSRPELIYWPTLYDFDAVDISPKISSPSPNRLSITFNTRSFGPLICFRTATIAFTSRSTAETAALHVAFVGAAPFTKASNSSTAALTSVKFKWRTPTSRSFTA